MRVAISLIGLRILGILAHFKFAPLKIELGSTPINSTLGLEFAI
jgi:hypothetical protein